MSEVPQGALVPERLVQAREALAMSRLTLSLILHATVAIITDIEEGRRPVTDAWELLALAAAVRQPPGFLTTPVRKKRRLSRPWAN